MLIVVDKRTKLLHLIAENECERKAFSDFTFIARGGSGDTASMPLDGRSFMQLNNVVLKRGINLKMKREQIHIWRKYIKNEKKRIQEQEKREKELKMQLAERKKLIDKVQIIKNRLKAKDIFNEYESDSKSVKLMPHQKAARMIADIFDKYAFFYDTGTGKTVIGLEIIQKKYKQEKAKFLILCPKSIIKTAWLEDCEKFYPNIRLLPLSRNITDDDYRRIYHRLKKGMDFQTAQKEGLYIPGFYWEMNKKERIEAIQGILSKVAEHYIMNPEYFRACIKKDENYFKSLGINGVIVDESAMLKNYSGEYASCLEILMSKGIKYLYLLSGKPAPNNYSEYYFQMKLVDSLGINMSRYAFKKLNIEKASDLVAQKSLTVSKEDCIDLPEKTYLIRKYELDEETYEHYLDMEYFYFMALKEQEEKEGKIINVTSKLASLMKLRQITSGFIMDNDDVRHLHNHKFDELVNYLEEIGDNQVIIWCQFKYEIEYIYKKLQEKYKGKIKVVTAYGDTKNVDESIEKFKKGEAIYLIAHPKTLKYGVTLTNCTYAVYYSLSFSFEEYYQSHDRIYRKGQTKPCTYIFLQAENTIDEIIYKAVIDKKTYTELFEMFLKDAENRLKRNKRI